ncbi:unnamed protein product, partial [Ectocarpus sp. 12 AP-2014]
MWSATLWRALEAAARAASIEASTAALASSCDAPAWFSAHGRSLRLGRSAAAARLPPCSASLGEPASLSSPPPDHTRLLESERVLLYPAVDTPLLPQPPPTRCTSFGTRLLPSAPTMLPGYCKSDGGQTPTAETAVALVVPAALDGKALGIVPPPENSAGCLGRCSLPCCLTSWACSCCWLSTTSRKWLWNLTCMSIPLARSSRCDRSSAPLTTSPAAASPGSCSRCAPPTASVPPPASCALALAPPPLPSAPSSPFAVCANPVVDVERAASPLPSASTRLLLPPPIPLPPLRLDVSTQSQLDPHPGVSASRPRPGEKSLP